MRYTSFFPRALVLLPLVLAGCSDESGEIPSTGLDQPTAAEAAPVFSASDKGLVYKFMSKGRFARLYGYQDQVFFDLSVQEGGSIQDPQIFLYFFIDDYFTGRWSYGWGVIPPQDFDGTRLHTNTSTNPDFWTETCWYDEWEWRCEQGVPTGEINITWTGTDAFSASYKSHGRTTYGAYTSRWQGSFDSESATAEGQLYDWTISSSYAEIGRTRDKYMEIVRGQ